MENNKTKIKQKENREMTEDSIGVDSDASVRSDCSTASRDRRRLSKAHKRPRPESFSPSSGNEGGMLTRSKRKEQIAKKQANLLLAEEEIEANARDAENSRKALRLDVGDSRTAVALGRQLEQDLDLILQVASRSRNLKGTFVRVLRESAASIKAVTQVLCKRTPSEEMVKLQAENARLEKEVESLRAEVAELREITVQKSGTPQPPGRGDVDLVEELRASIVASVGVMMDAKLAGIEERLLPAKTHRPPLATDRRREPPQIVTRTKPATKPKAPDNEPEDGEWITVVKKAKKKTKSYAAATAAAPVPKKLQPQAKKPQPQPQSKTSQPQRKKTKLSAPSTPAVLVTLRPEAANKGVTYCQVLQSAAEKVNLADLGIKDGLKMRIAATGARLLELPKGQTPEAAERLTQELRSALDGVASVVQPTKFVSIRIAGLDDSVTTEMVAAAVAKTGRCDVGSVKAGEVSVGPGGLGMVVARCPIAAAKILADGGKILIGWSSARVQVLEQRPLRCYKCMGIGHTRPTCPTAADRGKQCYRCGIEGHLAKTCTGALRCAVCADAGRPASHLMGGRDCRPPKTKGRAVAGTPAALRSESRQATEEVAAMSS
ncbi:unnamed protein product [Euphydryas editha]|uniref:CCHC-type domain-containing protein n=1 Tax=Euphydryas editha TaxID=104508 RepID=A0AAU9U279_EUPED|nr:unnamed protein product [Euphydryas editha]